MHKCVFQQIAKLFSEFKEKGFSDEELQKVIAFFDKYWKIYADKESMIAMIPEETPNRLEYWAKTLQNDQTYIEEPEELISMLSGGDNDCQTDKTIDVSNTTFIKLPKYYEVIQKLVPKKDDIKTTDLVTEEKTIQSKLDTLKNAKIRVIKENGQEKFISDNSEQEVIDIVDFINSTATAFPSYVLFVEDKAEKGYALSDYTLDEMITYLNDVLKEHDPEDEKYYYLQNLPEYSLCLLKRENASNEDEIFERIVNSGTTYYEYYAISEDNKEKFYAEVLRTIWGYISDKLTIPLSELSRENVSQELKGYGATDELVSKIINIIDLCEFAQYAPSQSNETMDKLYKESVEVIGEMENEFTE